MTATGVMRTLARLGVVLASLAGCHLEPTGRVVLIGIDGADPHVVGRLLEEERVPTLARIAREGAHGPLRAHMPLLSPRIWNSIATGKHPNKHGIFGFAGRDGDGAERLFLSVHRRSHALWNIASESGRTVGVVNWWNTYPPDEIDGVLISDHFLPGQIERLRKFLRVEAHGANAPLVFPLDWQERAMRVMQEEEPPRQLLDLFGADLPPGIDRAFLEQQLRDDWSITQLALTVEAESDPDLLMVFLPGIDRISHRLWGGIEPPESYPARLRFSESERRAAANALLAYYDFTDSLLERIVSRFGPDDLVVVVSDHGFEAGTSRGATGVHRTPKARDGIIFLRGPGIASGSKARGADGPLSVNDVTPTILAWLGLPIARDMDGRPAPFLRVDPPPQIATYDVAPIVRVQGSSFGTEEEILTRLREIGYLE